MVKMEYDSGFIILVKTKKGYKPGWRYFNKFSKSGSLRTSYSLTGVNIYAWSCWEYDCRILKEKGYEYSVESITTLPFCRTIKCLAEIEWQNTTISSDSLPF